MKQNQVEILLIEDNPDEAELAIRSLRKNNLANNLVHIDDGAEALDYIFCRGKYSGNDISFTPKVILLDLKLPRVGGLEILKQVKTDERTKSIPVVILTSSKEDSDLIEGYNLGVNSYIVKPVNFESFAKAISELGMYWVILNQQPPVRADR